MTAKRRIKIDFHNRNLTISTTKKECFDLEASVVHRGHKDAKDISAHRKFLKLLLSLLGVSTVYAWRWKPFKIFKVRQELA